MAQNKETGAVANRFGKSAAKRISQLLGLKRTSAVSNEVEYKGQKAVIKSARFGNHYIGVTLEMLKRIKLIIAAFETLDGDFGLYILSADIFKRNIRIGHHKHIALVRKKVFLEDGAFIRSLRIDGKV